MSINFNQPPYFDDYDETKKFHKILFRPGYAVQTRELNQIQSILQKQVERFGSGIYKEGAMVIPGGLSYRNDLPYVRLTGSMSFVSVVNGNETASVLTQQPAIEEAVKSFVGKRIIGEVSGVAGTVRWYQLATETDPLTLFVEYDSSGNDGVQAEFSPNETLLIRASVENVSELNFTGHRVLTTLVNPVGLGSAAEIQKGVYFARGNFVLVEPQILILDAYSTTPNYRVGLRVIESIVTPELDPTLSDNANGSFNFTAPGAHRYGMDLKLSKLPRDSSEDIDFIELFVANEGEREAHVTKTEYSELAKELARRTYDESGDYAVFGFRMNAKEARNNNRGEWAAGTAYVAGDVVSRTFTTVSGGTTVTNTFTYVAANTGVSGINGPSHSAGSAADGTVTWSFDPRPAFNSGHSLDGDANQVTIAIEPGKAYVRGFEIEKPSSTFVNVDKARDFGQIDNDLIATTVGNYVLVSNVTGIPDVVTYAQVNLLNSVGGTVGTARIRAFERDTPNFRLYLMDVRMNTGTSFERDVKSVSNASFSCTLLNANLRPGAGTVSLSGTTVTGVGTNFAADFVVNDVIDIQGQFFRVTGSIAGTTMAVANPGSVTITGSAYRVFRAGTIDPSRLPSIFPLGKSFIRSVRDESSGVPVIDTTYTITQRFTGTANGSGDLTVSLSTSFNPTGIGAAIDPNLQLGQVIVTRASNAVVVPSGLTRIPNNDTSFTLNGLTPGVEYVVFYPATKNTAGTASPKTKTLRTFQQRDIILGDLITPRVLSIGKADVYRVRQVLMAPTTGVITADTVLTDITNHFDFDNGQRDTHYAVSTLVRKPTFGAPTGSVRIIFDFFEHSSTGDYFCVDSYNIPPEAIPDYTSQVTGLTYSLSDVLDFRPRLSDDGSSFTGSGSALTGLPKLGASTRVDYTFFLGRIDRISLDVNGQFVVTRGSSAEVPYAPESPDLCMDLAVVTINPYTYSVKDVLIEKIDNRRYTMRDIGSLEKRINNLEYYTSLSLLEQEASSLQIQDEFGLNRFKNGFIVDNFTSHFVADATSPDFRSAIDPASAELHTSFSMDNINIIEKSTPSQRSGYQVTDDLVTLPYTETNFISQLFASTPENINPFAVFTFIGHAELNPPSDEWIETRRLPDVINDVEGNFSEVLANAQRAGILGTEWNAWETNWTGTSTNQFVRGRGRAPIIRQTIETQRQTRTGVETSVQATFSREFVGDRVVSTSVIPWIRSRQVVFLARNMRLNTIVYPFFDNTNISQFVTPASRIEFKGTNAGDPLDIDLFDFETNVGGDNDERARRFNDTVQSAYNKGDVIYVKRRGTAVFASPDVSPVTAVCVLQEVQPGGTTRRVLVVNQSGSFQPGDIIGGTISGSEGEVISFELGQKGGPLITNFGGDVAGVFEIPNTDSARFATGNREFKLIDNLQNNDLIARTRAHGSYRAEGTLQTWQATFNSVRNGEIIRNRLSDARTVTSIIGEEVVGWVDPLAQTFLVQNRGGVFVTSVDLWFASVDPVKPVTVQIREVVNGYPGKIILPFSNVTLQPYQLRDENQPAGFGLSANRVTVDGGVYLAPDKPTKFRFRAPVFLQDLTEYCIVLLSDSNNYHVWTSQLGQIDLTSATPRLISEQPYAGVLFKSQNASTWTADQNGDLTFRLNVAQFASSGVAEFHNARLGTRELEENPFFTRNQSRLIRVFSPNHGQVVGSKVTISGVTNTATTNGITLADLNKTHDVIHVEQDAFVIRVSGVANRTGRMGGSGIRSTFNVKYDVLHPIIQSQNFSDTSLTFGVKTTSSQSVSGFETPGVLDNEFVPIIANENNEFFDPYMVCSPENEQHYLGGAKSFVVRAVLGTSNPYLSPVIDTSRFSMITVNNRIDSQTPPSDAGGGSANFVGASGDGEFDFYTLAVGTSISFAGNTIVTTDSDVQGTFRAQRPGKFITITGASNSANNTFARIIAISADGSTITTDKSFTTEAAGAQVTIKIYDNFIDETAFGGSAIAKYLTKKVDLSGSSGRSTNLSIRFAADIPPEAEIDVYYKTGTVDSADRFEDLPWVRLDTQRTTQGKRDVQFNANDLPAFNAASVKLVLRSTSSANVPVVSDFIVIATV